MAFIQDKLTTNVDTIEEFIGFKLPVTFESVNLSVSTLESTQTNLTNLLSTQKGERMFQPNLGIDLRRHLFNPISPETSVALQEDVIEQVAIWLPFLEIQDVIITPDEGNNTINIKINYSFKSNSELTESVQVNLNTGATY
tara:strand:- start:15235 stop:15657 length:423 start_codon:yes stop_codon:yes gene_type:complete